MRFAKTVVLSSGVLTAMVVSIVSVEGQFSRYDLPERILIVTTTFAASLFLSVVVAETAAFVHSLVVKQRARREAEDQAQREAARLMGGLDEQFFANLVKITFKYTELYYHQVHRQAARSFGLCVFAMLSAFTFTLVLLVKAVFFDATKSGALTASAVTTIFAELISGLFFYLHTQTVRSLEHYHHTLIDTQNAALALRTCHDMPEGPARDAVYREVVLNLVRSAAHPRSRTGSAGSAKGAIRIPGRVIHPPAEETA